MPDRQSVYSSKVDLWIAALISGTFGLGAYLSARAVMTGALILATILGLTLGLIAALMFPTRYTITPKVLVVRTGLLRWHIPLEQILRIYPHRSVIASPALSLDRLAVEYQRARFDRPTVWISPKDRERFLQEIAGAAGLVGRGSELTRVQPDQADRRAK